MKRRLPPLFPRGTLLRVVHGGSDGELLAVPYLILFAPLVPSMAFARKETEAITKLPSYRNGVRIRPWDFRSDAHIFREFPCQEIPQVLVILTRKSTNISLSLSSGPDSRPFGPFLCFLLFSSISVKNCPSFCGPAQSEEGDVPTNGDKEPQHSPYTTVSFSLANYWTVVQSTYNYSAHD